MIRTLMVATILAAGAVLLPHGSAHAGGRWCAQYNYHGGATNCGFHSYQQCRAAISGNGGACYRG